MAAVAGNTDSSQHADADPVYSDPRSPNRLFEYWLIAVITLNSTTVIIDTVDVVRYVNGEQTPHLALRMEGYGSQSNGSSNT